MTDAPGLLRRSIGEPVGDERLMRVFGAERFVVWFLAGCPTIRLNRGWDCAARAT
jgi:hypothetical protein